MRTGQERGKRSLHGTCYGHTAFRGNIHADECLDKARCLLLQHGGTLYVGVAVGYAVLQRLDLGIDTHLCGRQSGNTHLHLDELHARGLLSLGGHLLHLADGSLGEVLDAKFGNQAINYLLVNWST